MKIYTFLALLVLLPALAIAQKGPNASLDDPEVRGLITGKILDKQSKTPMEYTSVAIYKSSDSTLVTGTVTNHEGIFEIADLPYGKYYIEIHFVGYNKSSTAPLSLSRESRVVDIGELFLSVNTKLIDEVEVVADRRRVEYKIDKKVINVSQDLNAAGGTAVDVLENTPSVTVDIEGNVSLRGSSNFTVLINGKPTVLDAADALRQIPASSIENMEIITNPSVKNDPDGNSGIINIILKKQIENGTTGIINASVGLNHKYRFDALLNRRVGKVNYFIGGGYDDNLYDGSLNREQSSTLLDGTKKYLEADGDMNFIRGGAQLKTGFDYDINPRSNLAVEASGGVFDFGINRSNNSYVYTIPASTETWYMNTDLMDKNRLYYSANMNYTHSFDTTAHKIVVMANFSQRFAEGTELIEYLETDQNYIGLPSFIPEKSRNVETGIDNEYRFQIDYSKPFSNATFEAGYQARIDDNLGDFTFQEYDPDTDVWTSIDESSSELSFNRNVHGVYAQYGGQIGKLQFQAGMRGEYTHRLINYTDYNSSYEIKRFDYYPSLHLARQFENDQQLMLSYSKRVNRPRGHNLDSIPSYIDKQTIRIGNPALEPEYVNSLEAGYQKGWGKNFLAYEAYYRNTTNLISRVTDYDQESEIYYMRYANINEDHVIGSELMANWQFAKWLNLNASTNVYYYKIMGELYGNSIDNASLSWRANLNATFTLNPLSRIQANFGYNGPSVTAQGRTESNYYMNLAVRQDFFKRKLSATLQVRDVFGSMKYEFTTSGDSFNQYVLMQREPRVVMLSLSYKINNYRNTSKQDGQESGGMDMDTGF